MKVKQNNICKKNESISCLFDTKDGKLSDEEYNKTRIW